MEDVLSAPLRKGGKSGIRNASEGFGEPKVGAHAKNLDLPNLEKQEC